MKLKREKPDSSKPIVLPAEGEQLIVSTSAGGHIPARVTAREGNALTIAIMVPIKPFSRTELAALVLEYTDARGRVRLRGCASVEDPSEPDLLRIEDPRSIEVLQQREYVRIQSARPVVVYAGRDALEVQSYTVDLSGGGFLLAGPDSLKAGDEVRFRLSLSQGATPIVGRGEVVRIDNRHRLAVAFRDISDLDRRRLVRFIFEAQRIERRRGLDTEGRHG
jgi:PilZ domain